jgi:hypothetical protein
MAIPITTYVNISIALAAAGAAQAGFGTPAFLNDHSAVSSNRLLGPYSNLSAVVDAGFGTTSTFYLWASAIFSQQPRASQIYSINRNSETVADALNAAVASNPSAFYAVAMESRTDDDILALAAWTETQRKIAVMQSDAASMLDDTNGLEATATFGGTTADGDYDLTFTGFGLVSPVTVTVTRTGGSPATDTDLAAAMEIALDGEAGLSGVLNDADAVDEVVTIQMTDGVPVGTITSSAPGGASLTVVVTDGDIGSQLFANQYTRSLLAYSASDAVYLDGAWMGRCLGFNLDVQKGIWAFKSLNGIAGASLTEAQATVLRAANVNYFAPAQSSAGVNTAAFTAQGFTPSGTAGNGRRIDVTTTLDWLHARLEEAAISTLLRETHGIAMDDRGINRFSAAYEGVFETGIAAKHIDPRVVPTGEDYEGEQTPLLIAPRAALLTTAEREARELTHSGFLYLQNFAEKVNLNLNASL